MKKLILLFTMVCTGQLYGMEQENIMDLPEDIRNHIIKMALPSSDTLAEAIQAIKAGVLRGVRYDNLKDFTKLVHTLSKQFNMAPFDIAQAFDTQTANKYLELYAELETAVDKNDIEGVKKAIKDGADITSNGPFGNLLFSAIYNKNIDMIKLLLARGAPLHNRQGQHILDHLEQLRLHVGEKTYKQIKSFIEYGMQKQQQKQ